MSSTCENIEEGVGGVGGGGRGGGLGGDGGNLQLIFNDLCLDESLGRERGEKEGEVEGGGGEGEEEGGRKEEDKGKEGDKGKVCGWITAIKLGCLLLVLVLCKYRIYPVGKVSA